MKVLNCSGLIYSILFVNTILNINVSQLVMYLYTENKQRSF